MFPENRPHTPAMRALEVHQPTPITPAAPAPVVPVQPGTVPAIASVVLPDGRGVTGYGIDHARMEPVATKPAASRAAMNVALGGVGFAACGGLLMLAAFITALTAFITQLITLAAVIFGGWITVQVFSAGCDKGGTTVNIRKAVIKRNRFHN